jgi:hypothetical protein
MQLRDEYRTESVWDQSDEENTVAQDNRKVEKINILCTFELSSQTKKGMSQYSHLIREYTKTAIFLPYLRICLN